MSPEHPIEPEQLFAHGDFLRRLALGLVADAAAADDLVQDAWLRALATQPGQVRRWRAWLACVVRSLARDRTRNDQRRARRERAAAMPERVADPAESAERLLLLRVVVDAVLTLDEPYRSVVLMRFFDGLTAREIAARQGVPLVTVETRLRRALAQLRERLDRHAGRESWATALLPVMSGVVTMSVKTKVGFAAAAVMLMSAAVTWEIRQASDVAITQPVATHASDAPTPTPAIEVARTTVEDHLMPAADATTSGTGSVVVQIVEAKTGTPVAGALVYYHQVDPVHPDERLARLGTKGWEKQSFLDRETDSEAELVQNGVRLESDAAGEVHVPDIASFLSMLARKGDLWGLGYFPSNSPTPLRVELARAETLAIQVVTSGGAPVTGVPVALQRRFDSELMPQWRGVTQGIDGIARVSTRTARFLFNPRVNARRTLLATLGFPAADGERIEVDFAHLPDVPIRLTLPPTGSIAVEVHDRDGTLFTDDVAIGLGPGPVSRASSYDFPMTLLAWQLADHGRVTFPHITLGLRLAVYAHVLGGGREPTLVEIDGPMHDVEVVSISAVVGKPNPRVTLRVIDESGEPMRNALLEVLYEITLNKQAKIVRTDGEGLIDLPLERYYFELRQPDPDQGLATFELRVSTKLQSAPHLSLLPERSAFARLTPEMLAAGTTDLGEIVLRATPELASGTVLDEGGTPIEGALVELLEERSGDVVADYELQAHSDAKGRFTLRGRSHDDRRLALRFGKPGYYAESDVPLVRGARELELVLQRAASLSGSLVLPDGIAASEITARADPSIAILDPTGFDRTLAFEIDEAGDFRLPHLRPGTGAIAIVFRHLPQSWEPIFTADQVVIRAAQENHDERLDTLDLGARIRSVEVKVHDEAGRPIAQAKVRFRPNRRELPWAEAFTNHAGNVRLWHTAVALEIEIETPQHERVTLTGVDSDRTVALHAQRQRKHRSSLARRHLTAIASEATKHQHWYEGHHGGRRGQRQRVGPPHSIVTARILDGCRHRQYR